MTCRAYNLGQRCTQRAALGSPYCWAHLAIEADPRPAPAPQPLDPTPSLGPSLGATLPDPVESEHEIVESPRVNVAKPEKSTHRTCQGANRQGDPCRFPPRKGHQFCINHDPDAAADRAENLRRAVQSRLKHLQHRPSESLMEIVAGFESRTSIQGVLDMVTRLTLANRITEKKAAILIRACSVASHNFDKPRTTITGQQPHTHDWDAYYNRLTALLRTIDPILLESLEQDIQEPNDAANAG